MPKRHLEAHTQSERAKQRQRLGSLKDLTVQPATRVRYNNAVDHFLQFLNTNNLTLPKQRQHLDPLVCEFLEYLWSQGYGRARASDAVAGLQDQDPKLRGHLQGAWRLLKAWNLHEIPSRAPPLPEHVLHAMVGWAFFHQHFSFGVSLLLGYYAMLRTGELLGLKASHLLCDPKQSNVVVSLSLTKGGKRQGAAESCVVGDDMVVKFLKQWKLLASPTMGFSPTPARWRALFNESLEALHLQDFLFRPYSLRRGGATWWFSRHQSLDKILVQVVGRPQKRHVSILMKALLCWLNYSYPKPSHPFHLFSLSFLASAPLLLSKHLSLRANTEVLGDVVGGLKRPKRTRELEKTMSFEGFLFFLFSPGWTLMTLT